MALDLHPDLSPLPLWKRALYGLCLIAGILGLTLFCIAVLVETLTAPGRTRWWAWWVLLPIAYSLWHVVREVPAWGPVSGVRWALFLASAFSLAGKAWTLIADPIGAIFFAATGLASAGLIGAARLLARGAGPPRNEDES
jgi:hypothetical protein